MGRRRVAKTAFVRGVFHINRHEADLDLPKFPQRIKDSDKLWAVGTKPGNVFAERLLNFDLDTSHDDYKIICLYIPQILFLLSQQP